MLKSVKFENLTFHPKLKKLSADSFKSVICHKVIINKKSIIGYSFFAIFDAMLAFF